MLKVIPLYAALLAFLYLYLTARVISVRRSEKISIGSKNNNELEVRIRVHGNFIEYTPFALILLAFLELQNFESWILHALGASLLVGRFFHFLGLSAFRAKPSATDFFFRISGMVLTLSTISVSAGLLLVGAVQSM